MWTFFSFYKYLFMECIFWNIRGLKGKEKHTDLKDFLIRHRPQFLSLTETKLDVDSLHTLKRNLGGSLSSSHLSLDGRILLLWNNDILEVKILETSHQFVHCSVSCRASNKNFFITSVYASNCYSERTALWDSIKRIATSIGNMGWIVGGDFNEVRYSNEKVGGQPVHSRRLRKFNSCILSSGLEDLKSIGHSLSWNNRQVPRIFCRLDRVLGNQPFISSFPHSLVEYLPPGISDHSPLKLICEPSFPSGPKPFKYFESWETHPSFMATVLDAWQTEAVGNPLFLFVRKLANVKKALKLWNSEVFGPIHLKLSVSKKELEDAQSRLQQHPADPLYIAEEADARSTYLSLLSQEEKFARQKSRQLWLTAGDSNTKFFYNSIKSRSVMNSISRLRREDNSLCSDPEEIKSLIVQYYQNLLNREAPSDLQLPPPPGMVSPTENSALCSPVLEKELRQHPVDEINEIKEAELDQIHIARASICWATWRPIK
ncbi:hypothetical protein QJS10_CPB14g01491 [Acorus calamus]|uniref:Endonuclease/exonuclease/phosphatase domain-containing protein n=1 Tax=Acorus calamus TaxID=4465 RepID=A0AAV9D9X3_ACOCL|nr:hypothetical protein QJS10_CPB14g01491 [Acorus calamus]